MKHRGIPRQLRYAVATALVLLSLLGLTAGFVVQVYFNTESACYEDLAVSTEDAITDLESNLRSDRTMLRVMAGLIGSNDDINSIEVSGYLTNYDYNSLVTQSGILLPGDRYMFSKARRTIVDTPLSFEKESLQGEHISGYRSENSNSVMIRNCVPIRKDGICIGVLYSAASSSSIARSSGFLSPRPPTTRTSASSIPTSLAFSVMEMISIADLSLSFSSVQLVIFPFGSVFGGIEKIL